MEKKTLQQILDEMNGAEKALKNGSHIPEEMKNKPLVSVEISDVQGLGILEGTEFANEVIEGTFAAVLVLQPNEDNTGAEVKVAAVGGLGGPQVLALAESMDDLKRQLLRQAALNAIGELFED